MNPQFNTDKQFLAALGELTVAYSQLETWMKEFANDLINHKDRKIGKIITSDMPFQPLWSKLMSLYRYHEKLNSPKIKEFETLLRKIETLEIDRNDLIHSFWLILPTMPAMKHKATAKFKIGLKEESKEYDVSKIYDLITKINQAAGKLFKLHFHWQIEHGVPSIKSGK